MSSLEKTSGPLIVTGGAGFVGSSLVRRLLAGFPATQVVVVDSFRNGRQEFLPTDDRLHVEACDLRDANGLRRIVEYVRPEAVFHLAALHFIPYCNANPGECLEVNVAGTENVFAACRAAPPQSLVIASTAAVYPISDHPCGEDSPAEPVDVYGLSKWVNEKQLQLLSGSVPTRCAAARISNVYGPRETNPHIIPEIVDQLVAGAMEIKLGNTAPKRDYVYVDDVAEALIAIAAKNQASFRIYNIATGAEYSVVHLVEELSRHAGRPVKITTDPTRVRAVDRMHLLPDNARLCHELGWKPRFDLEAGLAALWQHTVALMEAQQ